MKNTQVFNYNEDANLSAAADLIKNNKTVAFPTETVYGLGANALSEEAIKGIYLAKGRPSDNPLIVHITSYDVLDDLVEGISKQAKLIMDAFWPGPLTLIFKSKGKVAANVTPGLDTLAIRMPSHPVARKLIDLAGLPIAAPSANLSGKPSPTEGNHVVGDLNGRVDGIVIENQSEHGLESTILDMTSKTPMVLRPGSITIEMLEKVIGTVDLDPALEKRMSSDVQPKAPGMKYTHYSPDADVRVISGNLEDVITSIQDHVDNETGKIGIMCCDESKNRYKCDCIISLGSRAQMNDIGANLFKTLRTFDELGVDIVYAEGYDTVGMGKAIMNRLNKAAGYNITKV